MAPPCTLTCRAAVSWAPNQPFSIETIEVAPPRETEVRVRIVAAALCNTDLYTLSGKDPEGNFPVILGHEGSGIVESVGDQVTSVKAGDHVIPLYTPECRECVYCTSGKTNLCQKIRETQGKGLMPDHTVRFGCRGKPIHHFMGCSTFSEYIVLPEIAVVKIRHDAPLDKVCLLGCGITTGYGATTRTVHIEKGSTVAVFGLGCVGLSAIQGAKSCGAEKIIGIDKNTAKFDFATKLGATECIQFDLNSPNPSSKSIQQIVIEKTEGGVDYSFECVGNTHLMRAALECCHRGWGQSVVIGVAAAGEEISTRPFMLVTGRVWRGSAFGGVKGRSELPGLVDEYMNGTLIVDEYATHHFRLETINEALETARSNPNW